MMNHYLIDAVPSFKNDVQFFRPIRVPPKLENSSVAAHCWEGSQAKIIFDSDMRKKNFGPKQ